MSNISRSLEYVISEIKDTDELINLCVAIMLYVAEVNGISGDNIRIKNEFITFTINKKIKKVIN